MSLLSEGNEQMISFNKIKEVKYPEGNRVFTGCSEGYLYEYSVTDKKVVHDFGQILNKTIVSMAKTVDNKYLFVSDDDGGFREIEIATRKQVNNFKIENARKCVVTYNNHFLFIAEDGKKCNLRKLSIQTNQQIHTWRSDVNEYVRS